MFWPLIMRPAPAASCDRCAARIWKLPASAAAPVEFLFQSREQAARVGKSSEKAGGRGRLGDRELQRVFNGVRKLRPDAVQHSQMIAGECVLIRVIKGENPYDSLRAFQRHGERGAERGQLLRIIQPKSGSWDR